jgi:hypothetical protein
MMISGVLLKIEVGIRHFQIQEVVVIRRIPAYTHDYTPDDDKSKVKICC